MEKYVCVAICPELDIGKERHCTCYDVKLTYDTWNDGCPCGNKPQWEQLHSLYLGKNKPERLSNDEHSNEILMAGVIHNEQGYFLCDTMDGDHITHRVMAIQPASLNKSNTEK